jgi:hypothetical protein
MSKIINKKTARISLFLLSTLLLTNPSFSINDGEGSVSKKGALIQSVIKQSRALSDSGYQVASDFHWSKNPEALYDVTIISQTGLGAEISKKRTMKVDKARAEVDAIEERWVKGKEFNIKKIQWIRNDKVETDDKGEQITYTTELMNKARYEYLNPKSFRKSF